jgi:E3 ubiquitin-protein ligase UBR4
LAFLVTIWQVSKYLDEPLLSSFVERFLLDCNSTAVRWQAHALVVAVLKTSAADFRALVIDIFWKLWPQLPCYGRKAAQFVDLLGYFTMKSDIDEKRIQVLSIILLF